MCAEPADRQRWPDRRTKLPIMPNDTQARTARCGSRIGAPTIASLHAPTPVLLLADTSSPLGLQATRYPSRLMGMRAGVICPVRLVCSRSFFEAPLDLAIYPPAGVDLFRPDRNMILRGRWGVLKLADSYREIPFASTIGVVCQHRISHRRTGLGRPLRRCPAPRQRSSEIRAQFTTATGRVSIHQWADVQPAAALLI